jgi:hypothetical protein
MKPEGETIKVLIKLGLGDEVYLKADSERKKGIVVSYIVTENDVLYMLAFAGKTYHAYFVEIQLA